VSSNDTLSKLRAELRGFAEEREWSQYHEPKNLAMALAGELGELISLLQWLTPEEALATRESDHPLHLRLEDEIADVLIYLVQLADSIGVDPGRAAEAKLKRNQARFPPRGDGAH
jgi:NTP pyrophosphatase (non-canonical NTP hydrolase)